LLQFVAAAQISRVICDKMGGDRPRQPANRNCKAVARLMSFAEITCILLCGDFICIWGCTACRHASVPVFYDAVQRCKARCDTQCIIMFVFDNFWQNRL